MFIDSIGINAFYCFVFFRIISKKSSLVSWVPKERGNNDGTVAFVDSASGTGLHVRGDYQGNNGLIAFRTVLGDDRSVTDHMTVDGSTAGKTNVTVANAGGSGQYAVCHPAARSPW